MITHALEHLLVLAAEEGSEVTQAATKCLRFGTRTYESPLSPSNIEALAMEVGDLLAVVDTIDQWGVADFWKKVDKRRDYKRPIIEKLVYPNGP